MTNEKSLSKSLSMIFICVVIYLLIMGSMSGNCERRGGTFQVTSSTGGICVDEEGRILQ